MRDFSWKYFAVTGNIDAYLLYKEHSNVSLDEGSMETAVTLESEGEESSLN
jgi:hypothetical protein